MTDTRDLVARLEALAYINDNVAGVGPLLREAITALRELQRLREALSDLKAIRNSRERDIDAVEAERDRLLRMTRVEGPNGIFYTLSREQLDVLSRGEP